MPDTATTMDEYSPEAIEQKLSQFPAIEQKSLRSLLADYELGKYTEPKLKRLRDANLIPPPKRATTEADNGAAQSQSADAPEILMSNEVDTIPQLARELTAYFGSRISRAIHPGELSYWMKAELVEKRGEIFINGKKVVPPPLLCKNKHGNRYVCKVAAEWFERYMLNQERFQKGGATFTDRKARMEELALKAAEREDAIAEKKYRPVEDYDRHLTMFGAIIRRNEVEFCEKRSVSLNMASLEKCPALSDEQKIFWTEQFRANGKTLLDELLAANARDCGNAKLETATEEIESE